MSGDNSNEMDGYLTEAEHEQIIAELEVEESAKGPLLKKWYAEHKDGRARVLEARLELILRAFGYSVCPVKAGDIVGTQRHPVICDGPGWDIPNSEFEGAPIMSLEGDHSLRETVAFVLANEFSDYLDIKPGMISWAE